MALKHITSGENTIYVSPFMELGFKIITLDCQEVLGGKISSGRIGMIFDGKNEEAQKAITEQESVDIDLGTVKRGTCLKIHGVISHRNYLLNRFWIDFLCVPSIDFLTRRGQLIYDSLDSAIKSLWKGTVEIRTSSEITDGIEINQAGEYDSKFLGTLCGSYKKDSVFALGLDRLLIKDLIGIGSAGNNEKTDPLPLVSGTKLISTEDNRPFSINYDYRLYTFPETWLQSENLEAKGINHKYRLIHRDHSVLRENLFNNQKLYFSKMYSQLKVSNTRGLLDYRLGDVVGYRIAGNTDKTPYSNDTKYIISKIVYHYSTESTDNKQNNIPFKQEYTLHCLEEKGVVLNDKDPKEEK